MRNHAATCRGLVAAVLVLTAVAAAQQPAANLQLALDKPVELTIQDASITEVFSRLSAATGVKFVVDEGALECLPYGDQTRLSVTLKNVTTRKALGPMLAPQALRWEIKGETVCILPSEALFRMRRRATYEELKLLGIIHSAKMLAGAEAGSVIEQLRKVADNKDIDVIFHVQGDQAAAYSRADKALPGTAADWLDMLCHGQPWTWYLWADDIVVIDRKAQIQRQLQRQVSLRYQNASLITVLHDLARLGRVKLTMEPGVMNYLPREARTNFGLMMADATIAQALEVISGETGLTFEPTAEGVHVGASERLKKGSEAAPARTRSPFFVRMSLPGPAGAGIEVYFRADELPQNVVEAIEAEKQKLIEKLTEQYAPKPSAGE